MSDEILNSLLKEYEQKKLKAEMDLDSRKEKLYTKIPRLQEIENELNNYAIFTAKNILNNSSYSIESLNKKIELLKYEKMCILQNSNIDINLLKPNYECTKCNDTGYIRTNNYKTEMCTCLRQKLLDISFNKSNMSKLDSENFENFNENLFSSEVDISKYRFNISPRDNIKNIKQKCISFIENFDNPDSKNLLFTGNTGLR